MFKWFLNMFKGLFSDSANESMKRIRSQFCRELLVPSRHAFKLATDAYLRFADAQEIREELFTLDRSINKSERVIRKELVIHTTVHGTADFDQCLIMMSIVKDAERLGDIAKNIYDLAVSAPDVPEDDVKKILEDIQKRILTLNDTCLKLFDSPNGEENSQNEEMESKNEAEARELICQAAAIEDACDQQILWFLAEKTDNERIDVAYALAFRYFKRYASHIRNIASSIVQPVHKIDFTGKIVKNNPLNNDSPNESQNEKIGENK